MTTGARRRLTRAVASFAVLAAVIWLLHRLNRGALAAPPFGSLDELREWFDTRDAATAVFAMVRIVALVMAWYVLVVLALGALARLLRAGWLAHIIDIVSIPMLRRAAATLAGASVLSSGALGTMATTAFADTGAAATATHTAKESGSGPGSGPAAPSESLVALDDAVRPTERLVTLDAAAAPTETLVVLDEAEGAEGEATMRVVPADKTRAPAAEPGPALETWIIEPGEHLWAVAESHLTEAWGRPPTDAEITPYWRQIVEHNRGRLPDPSNPDLVVPGLTIELPPVPLAPAPGG
ncbi:MAG: hypothetical protein ACRD29_22325 [Acidimicrobiales bacterium]